MNTGNESKAGIMITVIFHLTVIIVLLLYQIDSSIRREESFVLDFSKQEEAERKEQQAALEEDLLEKLEERLAEARRSSPAASVRNIAVDAGSYLKDDRGTDAEQLYRDAERLARDLREGRGNAIEEDARNETVDISGQKNAQEQQKTYSGPSVVSYTLEGRKASLLKIPAYRCYGSGEVTVIITVDNSGKVLNAKVMDEVSSGDRCLREFAVRAARLSRFSASQTAPARQAGEIVYRFIAQ